MILIYISKKLKDSYLVSYFEGWTKLKITSEITPNSKKSTGNSSDDENFHDISEDSRSEVWNHFLLNRVDSLAKCVHCSVLLKAGKGHGTKSLLNHLQRKHSISVQKLQYKLDQSREESFKFESDQDGFDHLPDKVIY